MASASRVKTYTQAETLKIAERARRDTNSVSSDELRALALYVLAVHEVLEKN